MAAKQVLHNEEALRGIRRGVDRLANAEKAALDPQEGNVALDKKFGAPIFPKGGLTVQKRPRGPPRHSPSPSSTKKGRP